MGERYPTSAVLHAVLLMQCRKDVLFIVLIEYTVYVLPDLLPAHRLLIGADAIALSAAFADFVLDHLLQLIALSAGEQLFFLDQDFCRFTVQLAFERVDFFLKHTCFGRIRLGVSYQLFDLLLFVLDLRLQLLVFLEPLLI